MIGNNNNGKEVTLFLCLLFNSKESSNGIWIAKFSIAVVFVGTHLSNIDELNFNSIHGKFSNFHEWINPSSMQWDSSQESTVKFEYNRPGNVEFPIGTNLTGKFSFGYKVPFSASKFEIEEYVSLGVYADERMSFKDLYTRLIAFRNFLSLSQYIMCR